MLPSSGESGVHQRGAGLCGPPRVGHRGQRLIVDVDGVDRVCGAVGIGGNDGGNGIPWNRATSSASTRCTGTGMPGRTQFVGNGATVSAKSAPVTTVTTPGILTARSTETDRIRA